VNWRTCLAASGYLKEGPLKEWARSTTRLVPNSKLWRACQLVCLPRNGKNVGGGGGGALTESEEKSQASPF